MLSPASLAPASCAVWATISKGCVWKLGGRWEKEAEGYRQWNAFCALHFGTSQKDTAKTVLGKLPSYHKHVAWGTSSLLLLDSNYFYSKPNIFCRSVEVIRQQWRSLQPGARVTPAHAVTPAVLGAASQREIRVHANVRSAARSHRSHGRYQLQL